MKRYEHKGRVILQLTHDDTDQLRSADGPVTFVFDASGTLLAATGPDHLTASERANLSTIACGLLSTETTYAKRRA